MSPSRIMVLVSLCAAACGAVTASDAALSTTDGNPGNRDASGDPVVDASPARDAPPGAADARVFDARVIDARVFDAAPVVDAAVSGGPAALGAHTLAYHRADGDVAPLVSSAITTQGSGSTLIVSVGRGSNEAHEAPTDNQGNGYQQLGAAHTYTNYPYSGTALYAVPQAAGGGGHVITADTPSYDEITMGVVEVRNGGTVRDFTWVERLKGTGITSLPVTTTGPALLIAFWWGDADAGYEKTAVPNNGFQVIDSILASGSLVQLAVAVKTVDAAGTYDVSWTATPDQGAQLWLVAVE